MDRPITYNFASSLVVYFYLCLMGIFIGWLFIVQFWYLEYLAVAIVAIGVGTTSFNDKRPDFMILPLIGIFIGGELAHFLESSSEVPRILERLMLVKWPAIIYFLLSTGSFFYKKRYLAKHPITEI